MTEKKVKFQFDFLRLYLMQKKKENYMRQCDRTHITFK